MSRVISAIVVMIGALFGLTRRAHLRRSVPTLLAAVLAVAVAVFGAGPASAATTSAAQTRVGASTSASQVVVGASANITAGQRLGNDPPQPGIVVATGVAANTVTTSERISSPLWTAGKTDSAPANALRHFNDHGADFPGLNNSLEYVADAQSFLRSPPPGTLTRLRTNGDVVRYNPGSNTFGVMDSSGAPRTYFRPDPAQHGYPTNLDYFNAQ